jgi:hypothetical protein
MGWSNYYPGADEAIEKPTGATTLSEYTQL